MSIYGGRDMFFEESQGRHPLAAQAEVRDDACCDVCHEPLADECACQDEYRSEHDSGAER